MTKFVILIWSTFLNLKNESLFSIFISFISMASKITNSKLLKSKEIFEIILVENLQFLKIII
jgi:hypothetical protein